MISYAQNFEDVILERVFKDKFDGFYVDIGAAHPVIDSVTKHFYDKGWKGINIEPSPQLYNKLKNERSKDINLNIVITTNDGIVDFYDVPNSGLSSLLEENALSIKNNEFQNDYNGNKVLEPAKLSIVSNRLETIFDKYVKDIIIDFLKIDVEGAEKSVIESNNWDKYKPKILIIESTKPNSQILTHGDWEYIILNAGYSFVYFDGLNRFYLRNDLIELKELFSYPPCVFDNFVKYSEIKLQEQHNQLQEQHNQLQEQHNQLQEQHNQLQEQHNQLQEQHNQLQERYISLLNSYSWRITAPLRWGLDITKRVLSTTKRIAKAVLYTIPRKIVRTSIIVTGKIILKMPFIAKPIKFVLRRFPRLFERLERMIKGNSAVVNIVSYNQQVGSAGVIINELSPRARQIYEDLKREIEKRKAERK